MIFYILVGLATLALLYTHATAADYTTIPDDPSVAPYTVEILPMGTLLAARTLIRIADPRAAHRCVPRAFVVVLAGLSFVMCALFGVLWWLAGQYPAAVSAACVLCVTFCLLPRIMVGMPKLATR